MVTTHQSLTDPILAWGPSIEEILTYYASLPYRYGEVTSHIIINPERTHYILIEEGWEPLRRIYGPLIHAEIRDHKIWIHYDGTEDGIADDLIAAGIAKESIVLAFHPPDVRPHTGFAVN